jgi:hypothetical protein
MFARWREEVIPRVRPGILIKKFMSTVFFTAQQFIVLDTLRKGHKYTKKFSFRTYFHHCFIRRSVFLPENRNQFFWADGNSVCHNGHRVIDELRRLKISRAPHPLYSPDISPYDVWVF